MSMDNIEHLGPAPDVENLDTSTMDFGDELEDNTPAPEDNTPEPEVKEPEAQEDEPETKEDEEGDEKPQRDDKGRFTEAKIPKSRFDEQVGKERAGREAAERRAAELERVLAEKEARQSYGQFSAEREAEIEALETKHAELLLDGNTTEAAKVMKVIRHAERQIASEEAETRAAQRTAQTLERDRFDTAVARLEADYPQFNPDSELYDADLVALSVAKQRELTAAGLPPSRAMDAAAREVAKRFIDGVKAAEPEQKGLAAAKKTDDRNKQALDKALSAQKSQPSTMKDVGMDFDSKGKAGLPDVSKLTSEEYDALPESTKARLRGDEL